MLSESTIYTQEKYIQHRQVFVEVANPSYSATHPRWILSCTSDI